MQALCRMPWASRSQMKSWRTSRPVTSSVSRSEEDSDADHCSAVARMCRMTRLSVRTILILDRPRLTFAGTHGEVLHAGTVNMSDATRYFISIFLTAHGLPHRDSFATPQVPLALLLPRRQLYVVLIRGWDGAGRQDVRRLARGDCTARDPGGALPEAAAAHSGDPRACRGERAGGENLGAGPGGFRCGGTAARRRWISETLAYSVVHFNS